MTEYINKEKVLHHMWEALWKCEDKTEEQEGFDALNRFYIQEGFEAGLQAVIQEPITYDIEIEKQIPKKPTYENIGSVSGALKRTCNQCGDVAMIRPEAINYEKYCRYCGQRFIDWRNEE